MSKALLPVLLCLAALTGCSSSTYHGPVPAGDGRRGTVLLPQDASADGYDEYIPALARVLSAEGFSPIATGEARYTTDLDLGGGFGMASVITLKEKGVPIITARASNPGMGTWMFRSAVKRGLFNSSLTKFKTQLSKLP